MSGATVITIAGTDRRAAFARQLGGVLGLVFGHGLVGELGSVASVLGLICQLALIRAVPADMDVVERPQRAGLCRPVAAAIGRSLSCARVTNTFPTSRHRHAADDVAPDNHQVVSK